MLLLRRLWDKAFNQHIGTNKKKKKKHFNDVFTFSYHRFPSAHRLKLILL